MMKFVIVGMLKNGPTKSVEKPEIRPPFLVSLLPDDNHHLCLILNCKTVYQGLVNSETYQYEAQVHFDAVLPAIYSSVPDPRTVIKKLIDVDHVIQMLGSAWLHWVDSLEVDGIPVSVEPMTFEKAAGISKKLLAMYLRSDDPLFSPDDISLN